jgi:hypothetical protein
LVKERQTELAVSLIERPETTSKKLVAGRCQGLQEALDIVEDLLKGREED